ncbi:hypothetical protein B0B52_06770 [Polaromonas sp. A23]|nr:hypothetical protein B0B52_06770 [Polaromonas sp. A23]
MKDRAAEMRSFDGGDDEVIAVEARSEEFRLGEEKADGGFEELEHAPAVDPMEGTGEGVGEAYGHPEEPEDSAPNEYEEESLRHVAEIEELQQRLIASEEMLADVRAQIESESEEIQSEARKTGFEQGLAEGMDAAQEQIEMEIQQLRSIAEQLSGLEQQAIEVAEDSLIEMTYMAVCKLLGNAIIDGDAIKGVVSQLIERTRGMRVTRIRLRSEDCKKILDLVASGALGGDCKRIEFQPDDSIEIGGCILEGDAGTLDGRLESQLENLKATLLAARASSI